MTRLATLLGATRPLDSDASGQLLGYSIQFPRALVRLLELKPGGAVGIEVLGDVAKVSASGDIVAEEDKSSVNGNPVTDRSVDLWKTFSNWIKAIKTQVLDVSNTTFVLYTNQIGRHALVDEFHLVKDAAMATAALEAIKKRLADVGDAHEIWEHFDFVVNKNSDLLVRMLPRFEFMTGKDAAFDGVREALRTKYVHENLIDFMVNNLVGWLHREINEKIALRQPAFVTFEEFDHEWRATFLKVRQQGLIDFASQEVPVREILMDQLKAKPTYVKQLESIDLPRDEILEAVSDYLRADFNRNKWIESEMLDEASAQDFEAKLSTYWKHQERRVAIAYRSVGEADRGKILYSDCQTRQETIADHTPPDRTVQGTYHVLADKTELGWHPAWQEKFGGKEPLK